jgi:predicted membrane-bound spermidine synthase
LKTATLHYLAITTLSAACGLVVEITAGRMIAPYLGMSLYTWTAIIAVVLAGFSAGHWIGGRIAEWPAAACRAGVAWSLLLAGLTAALTLVLIRVVAPPVIGLGFGPVPTILLLTTVLFFLPSLFVGIPSPALTKLALDGEPEHTGHILGTFYAAGAIGSIFGTLAAGFLFISWLGTIGTILTVAALYAVMAFTLFLPLRAPNARTQALSGFVALVVGGLAIAVAGQRSAAFQSPCEVESDYYCIRSADLTGPGGVTMRSMVLDHLEHGINVREQPTMLVSPYVEAQDSLARIHSGKRSPFRSFFIGGGAFTLPRAWLAARPDAEIVVAEVDREVTRFARQYLWLPADTRLTVDHRDARASLAAQPAGTFDVVIGDAFHDISIPQHLVTREFFAEAHARLASDGIYLMNVVDSLARPRLALSIVRALRESFPVVEVWRSNQTGDRATLVIAGLRAPTPFARLPSRVQRGLAFERLAKDELAQLERTLAPLLLTDNFAPVDRLMAAQ